jgi:hypothetical protein
MEYVRYRLDRFDDPRWRKLSDPIGFQLHVERSLSRPDFTVSILAIDEDAVDSGLYEPVGPPEDRRYRVKDIDQYKCFDNSTDRVAKHRKDKADHDANRLDLAENNAGAIGAIKPSRVMKLWNEMASVTKAVDGRFIGQCYKLGGERLTLLLARIREYPTEVEWMKILSIITKRKFLLGHNDRKWVVGFDWLMKPLSIAKILEGKYAHMDGEAPQVFNGTADDLYGK